MEAKKIMKTVEELKSKINRKYLFEEFKKFPEITDKVRSDNIFRVFTGGVRINNGMYRTQSETDQYIRSSLMKKLP